MNPVHPAAALRPVSAAGELGRFLAAALVFRCKYMNFSGLVQW